MTADKDIKKQKRREYYIKNRERELQKNKEYYQLNKEQTKMAHANYYLKNVNKIKNRQNIKKNENLTEYKERHKNWARKYNTINKDKIKLEKQKYYIENKDKIDNRNNVYEKTHKEYFKVYRKKYQKHRRQTDTTYKLQCNTRSRLYYFLKNNKNGRTHDYICCTSEELWLHLEKQFKDGMTRENYGSVWHVDHRIPLQWFKDNDLVDETNKKLACHYGNLQPLFVIENLSKNDKLPEKTNFKY